MSQQGPTVLGASRLGVNAPCRSPDGKFNIGRRSYPRRAEAPELLECSPGRAVTSMLVRPDMASGYAIAHGGLVFAVAD